MLWEAEAAGRALTVELRRVEIIGEVLEQQEQAPRWCVRNRRGAEGTDKDQALTFSSLTVQWYKQRNVQWVALGVATVPHYLGDCPIVFGILPFPTRKKKKEQFYVHSIIELKG